MTKCEKVRFHLSAVAAGSLDRGEADRVHQHLAGCADCRRSLETIRKLRGLVALKCHEKPDEFFLRTFVPEFHRRLLSEMVQKSSFWTRARGAFSFVRMSGHGLLRLSSYGATVCVAAFCLYTTHVLLKTDASWPFTHHGVNQMSVQTGTPDPAVVEVSSALNHLILAKNHPDQHPIYVMDRVSYEPSTHRSVILEF